MNATYTNSYDSFHIGFPSRSKSKIEVFESALKFNDIYSHEIYCSSKMSIASFRNTIFKCFYFRDLTYKTSSKTFTNSWDRSNNINLIYLDIFNFFQR